MHIEDKDFYAAILAAGPILTGFCGTFLQFRIQREAMYYRQIALSYERAIQIDKEIKRGDSPGWPHDFVDIHIGLTHFTSSFALIILATLFSLIFGLAYPLAIIGEIFNPPSRLIVVGGLCVSLIFLLAYFAAELFHYRILSTNLLNDAREWREEFWIFIGATVVALLVILAAIGR